MNVRHARELVRLARRRGPSVRGALAALLATGLVATAACNKTKPAPEPATSSAPAPAPDQQTQALAPPAASAFDEPAYSLVIKPDGAYKAGQPGTLQVVLQAKPPYHCNDKYPYKLKLEDETGVSYPDKVVGRDAVKVEHMQATMSVPFTPQSAGTKKVTGKYLFSVCSADKCLVEKRDLALDVNVM